MMFKCLKRMKEKKVVVLKTLMYKKCNKEFCHLHHCKENVPYSSPISRFRPFRREPSAHTIAIYPLVIECEGGSLSTVAYDKNTSKELSLDQFSREEYHKENNTWENEVTPVTNRFIHVRKTPPIPSATICTDETIKNVKNSNNNPNQIRELRPAPHPPQTTIKKSNQQESRIS